MKEEKKFTIEEANELLPKIKPLLEKAMNINSLIKGANNDINLLEEIWGDAIHNPANPDYQIYKKRLDMIKKQSGELEKYLEKINEMGGIVKDLNIGLVDFFHEKNGELVFLCWKYGEDKIKYWHTIGGGFSGRRHISELTAPTR